MQWLTVQYIAIEAIYIFTRWWWGVVMICVCVCGGGYCTVGGARLLS